MDNTGGSITLKNSITQGFTTGNAADSNLVGVDPLFTNAAAGDYTLSGTSPAINAGSNALYAGLGSGTKDLAGNLRLIGTNIDLGSYEYQGGSPLPIKLLSFTAQKQDNDVLLRWITATEQNNKGFEVQHSMDGRNWNRIGFLPSHAVNGNSMQKLNYTYMDNAPQAGRNFYRLKQSDFNDEYEFSPVYIITFEDHTHISIYPNPATDHINIAGLVGNETIMLYDAGGRMLKRENTTHTHTALSLNELVNGIYHICITGKSGAATMYKIVKSN